MSEILVIGDDLTGTNATASAYARDGLRAVTMLDPTAPVDLDDSIQVIACSTGSRHMTPARAAQTVDAIVRNFGYDVRAIVKRFDTTLRGNIGAEIEATLTATRAMHPERRICGLVVPGFPAAHRTTVGGYQLLDGEPILMGPASRDPFTPVRHSGVAGIIHEQTQLTTTNIGLDVVMGDTSTLADRLTRAAQDAELVIVDSVTDDDQQRIATAASALESDERSWVVFESGPFGATYAHALGIRPHVDRANPILALIGSPTELTKLQSDRLESQSGVDLITVDDPASDVSQLLSRLRARPRLERPSSESVPRHETAQPPTRCTPPRCSRSSSTWQWNARIQCSLTESMRQGATLPSPSSMPWALVATRWRTRSSPWPCPETGRWPS